MLNLQSLREQVYQFLREEMEKGRLFPGRAVNMTRIAEQLNVSKTPLRDALIKLEVEGFVIISPRRGIKVNSLRTGDIKNFYEIIGALEASIITLNCHKFNKTVTDKMEGFNSNYKEAILAGDSAQIYEQNLNFHKTFIELSDNVELLRTIKPLKQRLYDFPRRAYVREWELRNHDEHQQCIEFIKKGDFNAAARIIRDVHWSYPVQEKFIRKFYAMAVEEYENEMSKIRNNEERG